MRLRIGVTNVRTWDDVPRAVRSTLEWLRTAVRKYASVSPNADPHGYTGLPVFKQLADIMGWSAGPINAHWGGPRPVANALVGAALVGAGGYGLGRLAERLFPEYLEPEKSRWRLAAIGSVLGSVPGILQGIDNVRHGGAVWDTWPVSATSDSEPTPTKASSADNLFDPFIPRDPLVLALMADRMTPGPIRAAAAGAVEAASVMRGSPWVSPWDIARVAIGTGSGAVNGVILGRLLGAFVGLTPQQQKNLQDSGWWAGLLKAVVPAAFNRPAIY